MHETRSLPPDSANRETALAAVRVRRCSRPTIGGMPNVSRSASAAVHPPVERRLSEVPSRPREAHMSTGEGMRRRHTDSSYTCRRRDHLQSLGVKREC
jgi:hypothetical protein